MNKAGGHVGKVRENVGLELFVLTTNPTYRISTKVGYDNAKPIMVIPYLPIRVDIKPISKWVTCQPDMC